MNERIKELVEKANGNFGEDCEFAVVFGELEDFEKFAELIVRECASIVECSPWNLPRGYKVAQAELVKKHFGVE